MFAEHCHKRRSIGAWQPFIIGPLIGLAVGALNGILVAGLRLPALVVTLGTLYIVRGLDYVVSNSVDYNSQDLPKSLVKLGEKTYFGILPFPFLLVLIFMIVAGLYMSYGQELGVVAAVVIGGISINGGIGTPYGAVIGALLVQSIQGGLSALGVDAFWKQAINGTLLIIALFADRVLARRAEQALLAQRIKERA